LNLPTFNLPLSPRRSTPQTTIQPRNSTIPCKILYLLANAVLPFPMFSSPSTSPANRSPRFRPLHSNGCHPEQSEGSPSVFFLAARHPPLATIPIRIRTYEKTPGGVHPSHQVICPAPRSLRILEVPVWFWSTKLCDTIFPTPER
jgi:hypothetical protein